MCALSKSLGHADNSAFYFTQRALCGDETAAVNIERIMKHPQKGYIIFEYLKCAESQSVTPYTSHPKYYWKKNSRKFLSLWRLKLYLNATLYLINYADEGTAHADEVLVIDVQELDECGIQKEIQTKFTFDTFSTWFRRLNKECLTSEDEMLKDIYSHEDLDQLGTIKLNFGKYDGNTINEIYKKDPEYLEKCQRSGRYSIAIGAYLKKISTSM